MVLCNFNCSVCPFAYLCIPLVIGAFIAWGRYASSMQKKRLISQLSFLFISNTAFIVGSTGFIYSYFYCWEAPLAAMACPIGVLEHAVVERSIVLLIYLIGFIAFFSMIFGRAACGWACPIGFLQDLSRGRREVKHTKADKKMRWLKYVILLLIPPACYLTGTLAYTDICPIGGLTATLPTLAINPNSYTFSEFFVPKMVFLGGFFILIFMLSRGWCRHLCPIGAMMAPFNKISLLQLHVDDNACIHCGKCKEVCPMDIDMPEDRKSNECVRCGICISNCPVNAISLTFT